MNIIEKYNDPPNVDEILEKIRTLPTIGDIKKLTDEYFPDWIVTVMDDYSDDYPHLRKNWHAICQMAKIKPTQIMIVEDILRGENNKLIRAFAECFTYSGFVVRRKAEFFPCDVCGKAIPSISLWQYMKDKNMNVPENWFVTCQKC